MGRGAVGVWWGGVSRLMQKYICSVSVIFVYVHLEAASLSLFLCFLLNCSRCQSRKGKRGSCGQKMYLFRFSDLCLRAAKGRFSRTRTDSYGLNKCSAEKDSNLFCKCPANRAVQATTEETEEDGKGIIVSSCDGWM